MHLTCSDAIFPLLANIQFRTWMQSIWPAEHCRRLQRCHNIKQTGEPLFQYRKYRFRCQSLSFASISLFVTLWREGKACKRERAAEKKRTVSESERGIMVSGSTGDAITLVPMKTQKGSAPMFHCTDSAEVTSGRRRRLITQRACVRGRALTNYCRLSAVVEPKKAEQNHYGGSLRCIIRELSVYRFHGRIL